MKRPPSNPVRRTVLLDRPPRVLLVFPTANLINRQILNGILRYAHQHGPWEFHMLTDLVGEQGLRRTKAWGCSGAIALVETRSRAQAVLATGAPAVFFNLPRPLLERMRPTGSWCCAQRDHGGLGRAGAAYFLERQYAHFAFVGDVNDAAWSLARARGFTEEVARRGFACALYPSLPQRERDDFGLEQRRLRAWLRALPKPVALMAAWDRRARQVLDTCLDAGLAVPHEIAVLGVDNDEILCETTTPPLSSVALGGENNGFEIARLLDRLMSGERFRKPSVLSFGLSGIVSRRSTEATCVADPLIALAVAFIQTNLGGALSVGAVAKHLNLSRRTLELRARQSLGRTVREEIQRLRFERVRSLLSNTDLTVSEVAAACGFYDPSHLCLRFRRAFGLSPASFRAAARGDAQ